jgi:predicted AAA+ superfamily ATPase
MRFVPRAVQPAVLEAARSFPAVVITGPRRTGKTTLLRRVFPRAPNTFFWRTRTCRPAPAADPRALIEELRPPVLFEEIQNVPDLLAYVRTRVDRTPRKTPASGFSPAPRRRPLMQGVTESMAGRAAILQLLPFSLAETDRVSLLHGGYPEVLARPSVDARLWFSSYIQTYLERDVRAVTNVRDLATFRRFLAMLASRHGQVSEQDRSGRSAGRLGTHRRRLAARPRNHRADHAGAALLREFRQAPHQVPQGIHRRFRAGLLPAGHRHPGRAGPIAIPRTALRRVSWPPRS